MHSAMPMIWQRRLTPVVLAQNRWIKSLTDYARRRDEGVMPMYELTCELATLKPPSLEMQPRFATMRGYREAISRFLGALAGSVGIARRPDTNL